MYARWGSFAIGLALILAPLVLGYRVLGPVLQDVAVGLLVCVATLVALERPVLRFALIAPAAWLILASRSAGDPLATVAEATAGAALLLLAPFPGGRRVAAPELPASEPPRAHARA
jgi:hypothetical protein